MENDEIRQVTEWAISLAEEYKTESSRVIQLFKAINKHFGTTETRNIIEKGFILAKGDKSGEEQEGL